MGQQVRHWSKFSAYVVGALVISLLGILAFSWTDASTDLTPGHDAAVLGIGLVAAVVTSIVVLALVLWLKPPLRSNRFVAATTVVLGCGIVVGLLTLNAADRLVQAFEFRGNLIRYEREFPVSRAYVSDGRGVSYHIQITEPFCDFTLSAGDYRSTFGNSEEVHPVGYCLLAQVEQRGDAMRIMYPSARPIPTGRVRPCSAVASAK